MKSFFKKLSLVLVAAMVITMLPAQSAKAATKVALGPVGQKEAAEANTAQTYELKVGETADWTFYGVVNYNAAGRKTKLWTSSNPAVATVANGKITAVAVGKTKITLTVTNNGIDYIGQADLTVVEKNAAPVAGAPTVKQVAWNKVEVTFADADAAKAAKDAGIKTVRTRTDKNGRELELFSGASYSIKSDAKNVVVVSGLSNEVAYKMTVPGVATPYRFTMSVGEPAAVKLTYPTVYISPNDKITSDISGRDIRRPSVEPIAVVVDANDIIVESNENGFKYSTDKSRNTGSVQLQSNGTVRINSANGTCYVKCEYSYKDAEGKLRVVDYDETTVVPVPYVTPNFQGFVEKITLTDKTGKEVEYPTGYTYESSIAIGETLNLAFYFETPDGDKYVPTVVSKTVKGSGLTDASDLYNDIVADGNVYNYKVVKDNEKDNKVSISSTSDSNGGTVSITGFSEGKQTICVYEMGVDSGDNVDPNKDKLVGILTVSVSPKAEIVDLHLSETSVSGFTNTKIEQDSMIYVEFKLEDQYGNNTKATIKVRDENGSRPEGVVITDKNNRRDYTVGKLSDGNLVARNVKKGYIAINTKDFGVYDKGRNLIVSVEDQADPIRDTIFVTTKTIDTTSTKLKDYYSIMVNDVTVKNKSVNTGALATGLSLTIDVANTKGGDRVDPYVQFWVIGNEDISKVKVTNAMLGKLFVLITREDGTVLKKTLNDVAFPLASEINVDGSIPATCYEGCWVPATSAATIVTNIDRTNSIWGNNTFTLDLIKNGSPKNLMTDAEFLKGRYTVTLYKAMTVGDKLKQVESTEVAINDSLTKISDYSALYELDYFEDDETKKSLPGIVEDNGEKVAAWSGSYNGVVNPKVTTSVEALVMSIVKELYVWIDIDSNGKCLDDNRHEQPREILQIKDLFGAGFDATARDTAYADYRANGTGFVEYSLNYVLGPTGSDEIFISDVTIRFRIDKDDNESGLVEQRLVLNTKYSY